jgi:hypothetical protein
MKKVNGLNRMLALKGMSKSKTIVCEQNSQNIVKNKSLKLNNYPTMKELCLIPSSTGEASMVSDCPLFCTIFPGLSWYPAIINLLKIFRQNFCSIDKSCFLLYNKIPHAVVCLKNIYKGFHDRR